MIVRIHIDPADWPRSEGVLVDREISGCWENVGLYDLRSRDVDVELELGQRIRCAGFRRGVVPVGAPAGVTALIISDYVEYHV